MNHCTTVNQTLDQFLIDVKKHQKVWRVHPQHLQALAARWREVSRKSVACCLLISLIVWLNFNAQADICETRALTLWFEDFFLIDRDAYALLL